MKPNALPNAMEKIVKERMIVATQEWRRRKRRKRNLIRKKRPINGGPESTRSGADDASAILQSA